MVDPDGRLVPSPGGPYRPPATHPAVPLPTGVFPLPTDLFPRVPLPDLIPVPSVPLATQSR